MLENQGNKNLSQIQSMRESLQKSQQHVLTISSELNNNQESLNRADESVMNIAGELGVSGFLLNTIEKLRKRK